MVSHKDNSPKGSLSLHAYRMKQADPSWTPPPSPPPPPPPVLTPEETMKKEIYNNISDSLMNTWAKIDVERPHGQKLCDKTAVVIRRVFDFFVAQSHAVGNDIDALNDAVKLTALSTGFSERTVRSHIPKGKPHPLNPRTIWKLPSCAVSSSKKLTPLLEGKNIISSLDAALLEQIRKIIHDLYQKGIKVTLRNLNELCKTQLVDFAYNFSHTKLWKILLALDFRFRKVSNRCLIFETPDLIRKRHRYLQIIKQLRGQNAYLAFCDETWIFQGMRGTHDWVDMKALENPKEYMDAGEKVGPDPAPSRGRRAIVIGAITETGMLPASFKVWLEGGRLEHGDYHDTMDHELFEAWLHDICPVLRDTAAVQGRKPVLVMDNASYHSHCEEKIPTTSSKKQEISEYLIDKGINCPPEAKKKELIRLLYDYIEFKGGRSELKVYTAENIASFYGVSIVRLPPYHCTLNPIEHYWAYLKWKICSNTSGKERLEILRDHAISIVQNIPVSTYSKFYNDAEKVEDDFINKESLNICNPLDIDVDENSDDCDNIFPCDIGENIGDDEYLEYNSDYDEEMI